MEIHVYSKFNPPPTNYCTIIGTSEFVPDQAMTIQEIMYRASIGVLSDTNILQEIPDDMPDYYEDLTDGLEPRSDDFGDNFSDLDESTDESNSDS